MSALRKVLVVDDDPVVGKSFNRVLSDKGYIVITAANGAEALEKLAAEGVDVVFTDIKMPGMNGIEVAERVKARTPWTPVVIITGYGNEGHQVRAKAAGVSDFLLKPLSPEAIEQSTSRALLDGAAMAVAVAETPAGEVAAPAAVEPEAEAEAGKPSLIKNMALFLLAPIVGGLYAVLLPFVGLGMLAWFAGKALAESRFAKPALRFAAFAATLAAAPFVGLAYFLLFPFVGMALLAWVGVRSLVGRKTS